MSRKRMAAALLLEVVALVSLAAAFTLGSPAAGAAVTAGWGALAGLAGLALARHRIRAVLARVRARLTPAQIQGGLLGGQAAAVGTSALAFTVASPAVGMAVTAGWGSLASLALLYLARHRLRTLAGHARRVIAAPAPALDAAPPVLASPRPAPAPVREAPTGRLVFQVP